MAKGSFEGGKQKLKKPEPLPRLMCSSTCIISQVGGGGEYMKNTWVDRLIEEYSIGKRDLEKYRETLDKYEDEIEYDVVTGMISDMKFALEWMKRGRRPGNRRGIEKQNVYQRTALLDTSLFPSLDLEVQERTLTDEEKRTIIDILWELSYRERQCYLLHMAQGWSLQEIADELGIAKRTVQQYVDRARKKIKKLAA